MTIDKSKVFHAVNAEEAEKYIGKRGWFSDNVAMLKQNVQNEDVQFELIEIQNGYESYRFKTTAGEFAFFYPAPEQEYRPFETCEEVVPHVGRLIKRIDTEKGEERHIMLHRIEKSDTSFYINSIDAKHILGWVFADTGEPVGVKL